MKYYLILSFFVLFSCNKEPQKSSQKTVISKKEVDTDILSKLEKHFEKHKIQPYIVINNVGLQENNLKLEDHKLHFIESDDEITIQIDKDIFSLKDKVTLNNVTDNEPDSVDFANTWQQARLYKHYLNEERDIIVLSLVNSPCVGLGCSVEYTLIYDCYAKSKSFFGSFRGTNATELFNYNGKLSYISNTYMGHFHGETPVELVKNLYALQENGSFRLERPPDGTPYFLAFLESGAKLEEHWIEKITE